MPEQRFYVRVRGKVLGPFTLPQLRALIDRGQFRAFHEVSDDRKTWTSASGLEDLFPTERPERDDSERLPQGLPVDRVAPAPPLVEGWRYVSANGQEWGPVSRAVLLSLYQSGVVRDDTLVWRDGMSDWQPLATVGVLPRAPVNPGPSTKRHRSKPKDDSGNLVTAGYILGLLSLLFCPPGLAAAGFVCGIVNVVQGRTGHGLAQIILSVTCGWIGMILGAASVGVRW
jgi:hypothetical protein